MRTRNITIEELNELATNNYEIIARCKNSKFVEIYFKGCGHKKEIAISAIKRGSHPVCYECNLKRFYEEGLKIGLELLPNSKVSKTCDYRLYKHTKCGGILKLTPVMIRAHKAPNFYCKYCIKNQLQPFADKLNFNLLEKEKAWHWNIECKTCKSVISAQTSNIKHNSITCHTCNPNSYVAPSSFYVIKITSGDKNWIKIGHSARIEQRIKDYGLAKDAKIEQLYKLDFATRREALKFENNLHKKLVDFALPKEEIFEQQSESGFTECYNENVLIVLNQEYLARELIDGAFNLVQ